MGTARRVGGRIGLGIALVCGAFLLGWVGYAGVTWLRYGDRASLQPADPLLDRFIPVFDVSERHEIDVNARVGEAYAAACRVDLRGSALIRAIFRGRELLLRTPAGPDTLPPGILDQTLQLGWGVLAEVPGRRIIMGAVTRPWEGQVVFRALPPEEFAAFDSAGYVKIVWTLEADSVGPSKSVVRTITRVRTTDPNARRLFRRYWAIFSPGILLIRKEALRLTRDSVEARPSTALAPPPP